MEHATQVALTRRVLDFVDRNTTELADAIYLNPTATYTCPKQAERERELLFRGHPLFFGLSCELPKPGDYRADDLSGVPVLVVRAGDGRLRAFLNVCRHRGAKVATGSGSGKRMFVCPYHAFTYDLEGRLMKLHAEGFPGVTCEERSLVPIPVAEKHGLIWVQASPGGAIDVDELLGGLGPEMASYKLDTYSHYKTATLAKDMNWKLVIDTFLETWHVATLHRDTIGSIFQPNVNVFDAFGRNGRMIIPRRSILGLQGRARERLGFPQAQRHRLHAVSQRAAGVAGRPFRDLARVSRWAARRTNASPRRRCLRRRPSTPTRPSATGSATSTCSCARSMTRIFRCASTSSAASAPARRSTSPSAATSRRSATITRACERRWRDGVRPYGAGASGADGASV